MNFIQPKKMKVVLTLQDKQIMTDYFNLFLDYCNNVQANAIMCNDCPMYDICPIDFDATKTASEFVNFICNQIKHSEEYEVIDNIVEEN